MAKRGFLVAALLAMTLVTLAALSPKPTPTAEPRRIAVRAPEGFLLGPELERISAWAKRRGIAVESGPEGSPVPKGWEAVRVSTLPVSERLGPMLARFPISFEERGFVFDGRTYAAKEDAILVADPARPTEVFVLGNSERSAMALAGRRVFGREERAADYVVVSGELSKEGRFLAGDARLAIDRASDRDRIAARDEFFRGIRRETRGGVEWEFRESERPAVARWEKTALRFAGKRPFSVRLFPDAVAKGLYAGSSRPADLSAESGRVRVDVDVSAPDEPDLVSPALAAAGLAAVAPALLERRTLLMAAGARRFGKWWGRNVRAFAAFTRAADVEPSLEQVVKPSDEASPILSIGAAAAWLDAGARLEGVPAVERAIAGPETSLREKLRDWRDAALRQGVAPPARRPLPAGFLRGISYAMTNSIEDAYVSPQSLATLRHLRDISANSISVMPYAFSRDPKSEAIFFVHRTPQGETDEGTLRAVTDARTLGMTAMVKPQLWVGGGAFVGDIAMEEERAWRAWFDSYRRFIVHHAVVGEASGADLFCVGTELKGTEGREKEWRAVVAAVRLATGAPLLYAANWAANAPRVTFWDTLDAVGVDFYDPLAKTEKASDAVLEVGARQAARPLADLARKLGQPVILTEAGYPPVRAAWIAPHDEESRRPAGGEDAARSIAAVCRALDSETWWKGVYWWKVFSDGRPAKPGDRGFNLLGTPAEKAIRDDFAKRSSR